MPILFSSALVAAWVVAPPATPRPPCTQATSSITTAPLRIPRVPLVSTPPPPASTSVSMLFDWLGPRKPDAEEDAAKFVRHAELKPGGAPLGMLCAGFAEDQLESLAHVLERVWTGPDGSIEHVPIVPLSELDLRVSLRAVLTELEARDSVLPQTPARVRVPLVLMCGFSTVQTSATVAAIRQIGLSGGCDEPERPMFAVVVPNALEKRLGALCQELEGDHFANARKEAPTQSS